MEIPIEAALEGARVGGWTLRVRVDRSRGPPYAFRVERADGPTTPLLAGATSPGHAARRPWIEARVEEIPGAPDPRLVFARLGRALPPGSYVMLDVSASPRSMRALAFGIPPACTREGDLLWSAGARWFKVWDFPEGGAEGGEKLQGNVPANARAAAAAETERAEELRAFLARPLSRAFPGCAARAQALLAELRGREIVGSA